MAPSDVVVTGFWESEGVVRDTGPADGGSLDCIDAEAATDILDGVADGELFTVSLTILIPGLWVGVPSVDTEVEVVAACAVLSV